MAIDDFLKPDEEMKFSSQSTIKYGGKEYNLYLTDVRLIFYMERGLLFKSDDIVFWKAENLSGIEFQEKGMIKKKGIISFTTDEGTIQIKLDLNEARATYNSLMEYI